MQVIEKGQDASVEMFGLEEPTVGSSERLCRLGRNMVAMCLTIGSSFFLHGDARLTDEIYLEHADSAPLDDETILIMTANVHGWRGDDGNNFAAFTEALEQTEPDVVCIQEVFADGQELNELYENGYNVYFSTTKRYIMNGRFGNAVISEAPLRGVDTVPLQNPHTESPRNAIFFEVQTVDMTLAFLNTHLSINQQESFLQMNEIHASVGDQVAVLCGDFNLPLDRIAQGPLRAMARGNADQSTVSTYPSRKPQIDIDHVISACGEIAAPTEVVDIESDHLARIETIDISEC